MMHTCHTLCSCVVGGEAVGPSVTRVQCSASLRPRARRPHRKICASILESDAEHSADDEDQAGRNGLGRKVVLLFHKLGDGAGAAGIAAVSTWRCPVLPAPWRVGLRAAPHLQ